MALSDEEVGRVGFCCHFANDLLCGENRRPVPRVMGGRRRERGGGQLWWQCVSFTKLCSDQAKVVSPRLVRK